MPYKKIEDTNLYEVLGLDRDARPKDVADAYRTAMSAYRPGALASYGLVTEDERRFMLERIEDAYRTLNDPAARRRYDEEKLPNGLPSPPKALFRKTVSRMEIQDAETGTGFLSRLRDIFRRKNRENAGPKTRRDPASDGQEPVRRKKG
jgi:DnaJ-class molecular chaperone